MIKCLILEYKGRYRHGMVYFVVLVQPQNVLNALYKLVYHGQL